jgi:hypothetical protein
LANVLKEQRDDMKIKEITFQHRNDFNATMASEHCGAEQENKSGYNDEYYHSSVIPAMKCKACGLSRNDRAAAWTAVRTDKQDGQDGFVISTSDADGLLVIAEIFPRPYRVAVCEENANLLAASKDLLAACRDALDYLTDGTPDYCLSPLERTTRATLSAAIAKATGKQVPQ